MGKKALVKGLIVSFMILLILSIVSFVFDFYFKIFLSLFLINLAFLFFFKIGKHLFKKKGGEEKLLESKDSIPVQIFKFVVIYGIPLLILGYVLYFNFLPFGFEKTYIIDVGVIGDTTTSNEFY